MADDVRTVPAAWPSLLARLPALALVGLVARLPALALVGLVVLALTGCGAHPEAAPVANVSVHDDDGLNGVALTTPYRMPDVRLVDTAGRPYHVVGDTTAPLTLMFFGYTRCPDVCALVMADVASAMTRLDAAQRSQVGMLFLTTDPARDDPATLREYLDRFDPRFEGLTGPVRRIVAAGDAVGVLIERGARLPSGGYEVSHGSQLLAMRPDGSAPYVWTEGTGPSRIAHDLERILDGRVGKTGGAS